MKAALKRQPPEGGGIVWLAAIHAFQCLGCEEHIEERKRRNYDDPEWVAQMKQLLAADHVECWEFADPQMARDARKFRKRKKLQQNLAAQSVSWRGSQG